MLLRFLFEMKQVWNNCLLVKSSYRFRLVSIIPLTISGLTSIYCWQNQCPPQEVLSSLGSTFLVFQFETKAGKFHTLSQKSVSITFEPVSLVEMFLGEAHMWLNISNDSWLWASGLISVTCRQKPPTPIITERRVLPSTHFVLSSPSRR